MRPVRLLCLSLAATLAACGRAPDPASAPLDANAIARPDRPHAWARWQRERRVPEGATEIPMQAYARAEAQAAKLARVATVGSKTLAASAKAAPRWQFLGPGNVAGRARTLVFDPRDSRRLLLGGASGGVFESRDAGASWRALSDNAANLNIGALVLDPRDPDRIFAGTGELYRNSDQPYSAMWGQGILRSVDGGRSFQQLPATANDDFRYVADLVFSAHVPNRLYAATNTGIWRSDDGGLSFVQLLRPADGNGALRYEGCNELELLPHASRDVLLAGCASRSIDDRYYLPGSVLPPACAGPCPAAVFRNDDAGGSGSFTPVLSESGMGRTLLRHARSNPAIVYALSASIVGGPDRTGDGVGDYDNGLHALFRSDDGGLTFTAVLRNTSSDLLSTYLLSYADSFSGPFCGQGSADPYSAGWYNMALAVDPTNPERVWAAGMEHYRSDDGGRTFGRASWWEGGPSYVHADQHLLVFHPDYDGVGNRQLYSANDGGLIVTDDATAAVRRDPQAACRGGSSAVRWRTLVNGLGTTQFYTGAVTADGTMYLGGTQDNGTLLSRSDGTNTAFAHVFGGDGAHVAIDPRNRDTFYLSYQLVNMHRTTDGGQSFQRATAGLSDVGIFIFPYVLDENAPDRLWAGGTRLWRTDNQGRNWRPVSMAFANGDFRERVSALAVAPGNSNRMLVGNAYRIHYSSSALSSGASTSWPSSAPRSGWVSSLTFDPVDSNVAYATYSSFGGAHVWRTSNGGASWTSIDGEPGARLPDIPVHTLAVDPGNRQRLYVGTDLGVFVTTDGGAHWAVENTGFAQVIVEQLRIGGGRLYAFTYGRGVWRVPLADLDGVASYRLDQNATGAFYDPAQDGQGWVVESTTVDGTPGVVAAFYTYQDGEPRWFYGTGSVVGERAELTLYAGSGGDFPPEHLSSATTLARWGTATLVYESADRIAVSWDSQTAGFADGAHTVQRLATLAPADPNGLGRLASCHGGSWYDPAQPGHGLQVQVIGDAASPRLLVVWYAYLDGRPVYLIGDGPITGDTADVPLVSTRGADFPPDFRATDVVRVPWGSLRFRAVDGNRARVEWTSTQAGFGAGALDLTRLTALAGNSCR